MFIFLTNSTGFGVVWQTIKLILIFIIILVLAYYGTKLVAGFHKNSLSGRTNLKIVESMSLGNNKFLVVVEIDGSYYALGVGKDNVTLIDKLSDYTPRDAEGFHDVDNPKKSFKDVLAQFKTKSETNNKNQDTK
ncbi:MAG: flagellar biosynthetic protein FliO [Clostridium sp.]|nr:flagellar biosynthetic protein FliO [Clostridium sp.]MCM1209380.1 flagellar biosynthetic protein FliO [Ruminococcus sp.]